MKKLNKKSVVLLICAALLLTFTVSGTVAYLVADTDPVENVFTPATVDTEIKEEFEDSAKTSITIKNNGSIDMYVRVMVVANYVDNTTGAIVASADVSSHLPNTGWTKIGNYYYYTSKLSSDGVTSNLLSSPITPDTTTHTDAHLEVTVIHQSIQAEPETTVESAWNVTVENGVIQ